MSRHFTVACAGLTVLSTSSFFISASADNENQKQIDAQIQAGKVVFDSTCSAGSCHGGGGIGGRAPALTHAIPQDLITDTVLNGRPGTPMPAFKGILDSAILAQVIAYVSSLTSGGRQPTSVVVIPGSPSNASSGPVQSKTMPWLESNASVDPVGIGSEQGIPSAGAARFFDATKLTSCHTCHSYAGAGGPIGRDLASTDKTPLEICQVISNPKSASPGYAAVRITLISGSSSVGIEREENEEVLRYYDVSSLPPILRTLRRSAVKDVKPLTGTGIYDHTTLPYTKQDRLNLCAFLGKARGQVIGRSIGASGKQERFLPRAKSSWRQGR